MKKLILTVLGLAASVTLLNASTLIYAEAPTNQVAQAEHDQTSSPEITNDLCSPPNFGPGVQPKHPCSPDDPAYDPPAKKHDSVLLDVSTAVAAFGVAGGAYVISKRAQVRRMANPKKKRK